MKHLLLLVIAFVTLHVSHSTIPGFCQLQYDEGSGGDIQYVVYYDSNDDQCYPFIYKGEGGNANRFHTEMACIRNCSTMAEDIYPMNVTKACSLEKAVGAGKCKNRLLRFYYDSVNDKCIKFYWSGCNGNGNRFPNRDSCLAICTGIHNDGDKTEEEEPDTPVAIILGVLLAVTLVGGLIAVIVLTVKSKKKKSGKAGGKKKDPKTDTPLREQTIEMT
ncbi:inter-alpha-trypsin inhibitor [Chaetodon auriga]|uniref:inter-alpha-trypsin inhibitor n=1 Tax=Chaetodon auriga TaxID=39042 RepID=UPI004032A984